jgi:hypothetical protein
LRRAKPSRRDERAGQSFPSTEFILSEAEGLGERALCDKNSREYILKKTRPRVPTQIGSSGSVCSKSVVLFLIIP